MKYSKKYTKRLFECLLQKAISDGNFNLTKVLLSNYKNIVEKIIQNTSVNNKRFKSIIKIKQNNIDRYVKNNNIAYLKYISTYYFDEIKPFNILFPACKYGNLDAVIFTYAIFANTDNLNESALKIAAKNGHLNIIEYILYIKKVAVSSYEGIATWAAMSGHCEIVKYFYNLGVRFYSKERVLLDACEFGYLDIAEFLIELGANIHLENEEVLNIACINGHKDIMKLLIKNGANANLCTDEAIAGGIKVSGEEFLDYINSIKN